MALDEKSDDHLSQQDTMNFVCTMFLTNVFFLTVWSGFYLNLTTLHTTAFFPLKNDLVVFLKPTSRIQSTLFCLYPKPKLLFYIQNTHRGFQSACRVKLSLIVLKRLHALTKQCFFECFASGTDLLLKVKQPREIKS